MKLPNCGRRSANWSCGTLLYQCFSTFTTSCVRTNTHSRAAESCAFAFAKV